MTIVRSPRPDSGYLQLSNDVARDSRLSYRARGVLVALLSRPDNWKTTATHLCAETPEGRDAVRSALAELEAVGYLVRERVQDAAGKWSTVTTVFDMPPVDNPVDEDSPKPENPSSVRLGETVSPLVAPKTENQASVFQALKEEPRRSTKDMSAEADESSEANGPASSPASVDSFDEFWAVYPRTRDVSKKVARQKFALAARSTEPDSIIAAATRYAEICTARGTAQEYIAHPATWLNQERYLADELQPDYAPTAQAQGWW